MTDSSAPTLGPDCRSSDYETAATQYADKFERAAAEAGPLDRRGAARAFALEAQFRGMARRFAVWERAPEVEALDRPTLVPQFHELVVQADAFFAAMGDGWDDDT